MRSLFSGLLTVLFLFGATSAGAADSRESGIGIRLVDIPQTAIDDPRARSYIVDSVPPGTLLERRVEVQNNTADRQEIAVYATAAEVKDNSFVGLSRGSQNELTGWMGMGAPAVDLAPGESTDLPVTIRVPEDAPEGEQYAAVWAEVRSPAQPGTQVITASRTGIRVYLNVGPGNGPGAAFSIGPPEAAVGPNGGRKVTAQVTNTGGRALDVQGELNLINGPGGLSAGPSPLDETLTIPPGEAAAVAVTLPAELPAGRWHAQLALRSGVIEEQAAAEVVFENPGPVDGSGTGGQGTAALAAAAAVVLLGVLWGARRRHRTKR